MKETAISRRASLLALTFGSGAIAAGVASNPAMADCHDSTLPGLCGIDVDGLRELHRSEIERIERLLEENQTSALSQQALKESLARLREINAEFLSDKEQDNIARWIEILFEDIERGVEYIYHHILSLVNKVVHTFGDVARTIVAIFLDALDKARDIASRLSNDQIVKVVAHDLRGALDGLDIATHLLGRFKHPVKPAVLMFSALIGGTSGSIIGYYDYAYSETDS